MKKSGAAHRELALKSLLMKFIPSGVCCHEHNSLRSATESGEFPKELG